MSLLLILIVVGSTQICAGPGTTVWIGSGFNCPDQSDQILLSHTRIMAGSASGECNDGSILGQGIGIIDTENCRCYNSQLNVTVSHHLNNTDIRCIYDDAISGTQRVIGNSMILLSGPPQRPMIYMTDANSTQLTFMWSSVVSNGCLYVNYIIIASINCGSCPNHTQLTNAVCSNFSTSVETDNICNFTVIGVICGNISGSEASLLVNLKVPDAPVIESTPVYLKERPQVLTELKTSFSVTDAFNISNTIDGSATSYTITHSDSISGKSCSSSTIIPSNSCVKGICSHIFNVLSSSNCSATTNITTTVFASNILGHGPPSNSITTDGVNNFIRVNFDLATNRLNCTFLNLPKDDLKQCTANITYGTNCDRQLPDLFFNESNGDFVTTPPLELISDIAEYCYVVIASSGNITAAVRGRILITPNGVAMDIVAIVIPSVAVIILSLVLIVTGIIILIRLYYWHKQILKYAIKISIKNDIESHIQALRVFEEFKVNINGFNTYFHHKDFKRQDDDQPGYSVYFVHCKCPTNIQEVNERLTYVQQLVDNLREKLAPPVPDRIKVINAAGGNIFTIRFPIRDEVGSLRKALCHFKELSIELVGINTRLNWESHGNSDNYIKFSCSRPVEKKIITQLDKTGAQVKDVVVQVREGEEPTTVQVIDLYVENKPGNLAATLNVFEQFEMNITRINKLIQDTERGFRNILVKCYCNDAEKLKTKLNDHHACNIEVDLEQSEGDCNCTVTYSVLDEKGSLLDSLRAFQELGINIVAINPLDDDTHNIEYQKNSVEFVSTNKKATQLIEEIQRIGQGRAFVNQVPPNEPLVPMDNRATVTSL